MFLVNFESCVFKSSTTAPGTACCKEPRLPMVADEASTEMHP